MGYVQIKMIYERLFCVLPGAKENSLAFVKEVFVQVKLIQRVKE